jgi:hypothetical protein
VLPAQCQEVENRGLLLHPIPLGEWPSAKHRGPRQGKARHCRVARAHTRFRSAWKASR